jgi:hypothetical protein
MRTEFPDPDDTLNFTLTIEPDEGMYKDGTFNFSIAINQNFPHDAPKVKCKQKIYHPNIDLEGNVCLNILRGDWKPVLNLNAVFVGLQVRISPDEPRPQERWGTATRLDVGIRILTVVVTVSLPRAERIRPVEQGGCGRSTAESGRLQAQCEASDERWSREGRTIRPSS